MYSVVIVSAGVKITLARGFVSELEGKEFCDRMNWQYLDENEFLWDLEVEEDNGNNDEWI